MKLEFVRSYKNPHGPGFVIEIGNPPGKWMQAKRPTQYGMRCDGAGCEKLTDRGDWYWRDGPGFALCERCASGVEVMTWMDGEHVSYVIPAPPR